MELFHAALLNTHPEIPPQLLFRVLHYRNANWSVWVIEQQQSNQNL